MDLNGFIDLFVETRSAMSLPEAIKHIRYLRQAEFFWLPKNWKITRHIYSRRLAQIAVCEELEEAFTNAAPWEDYREIMARLEWPYLQRVARHSMNDIYSGSYGRKWGEADVWFVDMWMAYHDVFCKFPGITPNNMTPWKIYDDLMHQVQKKTARYRRNW